MQINELVGKKIKRIEPSYETFCRSLYGTSEETIEKQVGYSVTVEDETGKEKEYVLEIDPELEMNLTDNIISRTMMLKAKRFISIHGA